jgi:hypothetical protein
MSHNYKHLHELEDQLIQIMGLMKALQILLPDGKAHTCVADELENRLREFEKKFYEGWKNENT